jgi:hypothetical protein
MLGDTRDAGAQALLDTCLEMGLSSAQVEYVITTESQRSLAIMQYGGSIFAAHFDSVTTQHQDGQRKIMIVPIAYNDSRSRLRIYTDNPDTATGINALGILTCVAEG